MSAAETPSRRDLLAGRLAASAAPEAHVSSLVVHVRREALAPARAALLAMPGVEVHAEAGGKLIVTLETETEADIVTSLNGISLVEGVLSAALVFHHCEAGPAREPDAGEG